MDILPILGSAIISAVLVAALMFLTRKWIFIRLQESIRFEYARLLEKYKVDQGASRDEMRLARDADVVLLNSVLRMLPSSGAINVLRTFEPALPHSGNAFYELIGYWTASKAPDFHFHDAALEACQKTLRANIAEFLESHSVSVFSHPTIMGMVSVPKEWAYVDTPRFEGAVGDLREKARLLLSAYDDLVLRAKASLKC